MADLEYTVTNQGIATTKTSRLVSGTIGVYTVKFTFNNVWDGLEKWATFDPIPGTPYKQPLDANGECTIPGEVMGGVYLRIGVFGLAEGQAYPTIWASKLPLEEGCFVNVPPSDWPEPSPLLEDVVKVSEQTFTDAQKTQARTNIGAAGSADMTTALAGKVDKPVGATEGNVAVIGSNQNIVDGGFKATEAFPVGSASGSIVTIEDGANNVPVKSMTVQIEPNQKVTINDVSPTNICLINGWTSFNVNCSKKNLWGGAKLKEQLLTYVPSGVYDDENHTFDFSAAATVVYNQKAGRVGFVWIPFKENTRYTFVLTLEKTANAGLNLNAVYTDGTSVVIPGAATPGTKQTFVYTTLANKTLFYIGKRNSGGHTILHLDECGVFEGVLTADNFVPYNGNTYEIEFPTEAGTVYGGELVVNEDGTGRIAVDCGFVTYDGSSDEVIQKINNASYNRYVLTTPSDSLLPAVQTNDGVYFNWLITSTVAADYNANLITNHRFNVYLPLSDSNFTSVAAFRSYLASHPLQATYPLADPITYDLTVEEVASTLHGLNNIWADTGDISITYRADPTLATTEQAKAVKQSIAPVEDGYTASQAYAVGSFLFVGDTLYKVTSAIASGATITPNTNCVATTVAEQLMALA